MHISLQKAENGFVLNFYKPSDVPSSVNDSQVFVFTTLEEVFAKITEVMSPVPATPVEVEAVEPK